MMLGMSAGNLWEAAETTDCRGDPVPAGAPPTRQQSDPVHPHTATARLSSAVAQQLVVLHQRARVQKGSGTRSPARQAASAELWRLVHQQYQNGVPARELANLLGVARGTILSQLRHHGYLRGPSGSMRAVASATGPSITSRGPAPSRRLSLASRRMAAARERLTQARAEAASAWDELRQAAIAEHGTSELTIGMLAAHAGVTVRTVLEWVQSKDESTIVQNPRATR